MKQEHRFTSGIVCHSHALSYRGIGLIQVEGPLLPLVAQQGSPSHYNNSQVL